MQVVPSRGASPVPKVTVIVPLFNVAGIVHQTLDSLFKQSLDDVEYLLIDDGSTDGTFEMVRELIADRPGFTVIRQENSGPAAARNRGLRLAKGQYLFFLDADDTLATDALRQLYDAAVTHDADLVIGETVRWDGQRVWRIPQYVRHGVTEPGVKHITTHPGLLYAMGPCAKLYKRELLKDVYFPEQIRLGEDQPVVLQAYVRAHRIYVIDAVVYYYRVSEAENPSLTHQALQNPIARLGDLYEMVAMANRQLANQPLLFRQYLHRVMVSDILPRVRAALNTKNAAVQIAALKSLCGWLESLDRSLFNTVPGLYAHLPMNLLYGLKTVRKSAVPEYRKLIRTILKSLNTRTALLAAPTIAGVVFNRVFSRRG